MKACPEMPNLLVRRDRARPPPHRRSCDTNRARDDRSRLPMTESQELQDMARSAVSPPRPSGESRNPHSRVADCENLGPKIAVAPPNARQEWAGPTETRRPPTAIHAARILLPARTPRRA